MQKQKQHIVFLKKCKYTITGFFATIPMLNNGLFLMTLADVDVLQLQDVCRCTVRQILRQNILDQNPGILKNVIKKATPKSKQDTHGNRSEQVYRYIIPDRTVMFSQRHGLNDGDQADDDEDTDDDDRNFVMDDDDLDWADILTLMRSRIMPVSIILLMI